MLDSLSLHNKKERPKVTEPVIPLYHGSHHLYYVMELVGLHSYALFLPNLLSTEAFHVHWPMV